MTSDPTARLALFCRERAGKQLRSVTRYDEDGFDPVYLRADLRATYTAEGFAELIDAARAVHPVLYDLPADTPLGPYSATVHAFDEAVVLQFAYDHETGCLVSFDRTVGRDLTSFVSTCLDILA